MARLTPDSLQLPRPAAEGPPSAALRAPGIQIQLAGGSGVWRRLLLQAEAVAPRLWAAFIEGEEGTGKETLARCLHARSLFAQSAFERHDARRWIVTRGAAPIEGFIYLDRVDALSVAEQRLLWEATKNLPETPRGGGCLVASSRAPFRQLMSEGAMMPNLLFRLGTVHFAVPPLRARREDIAPLVHFLLDRASRSHQRPHAVLAPGALARLMQHHWPGNVAELSTVLESALLEATEGVIRVESLHLPASDRVRAEPTESGGSNCLDLHTMIRQHVRHVLNLNQGNKLRSSRQLGISRSTLYRILGNESVLGR
ncbi:MAG: sigma 54-interacting transcriptional regulator [Terracidiphilus sp.]